MLKNRKEYTMSFLLDYTSGIGMPRPQMQHQEVLSFWLTNMNLELRPRGFFALAENAVVQGKGERVPDIVIYNPHRTPLAFFEIARSCQIEKDMEKCEELMDLFPAVEYFVMKKRCYTPLIPNPTSGLTQKKTELLPNTYENR